MNFWKPGEDHPDQDEEINQEEDVLPLSKAAPKQSNKKKQMSDNLKNMPFMIRSNAEKQRRKEEYAALKDIRSYMWTYRKVKATEDMDVSNHPCSGPIINTFGEEECKRFSFGGFNPRVDEIMKERKEHRRMKKGVKKATDSGVDVKDTLRKYSTFRENAYNRKKRNN